MTDQPRPDAVVTHRSIVALVVFQVGIWAWVTARGYFYLDDFELGARAAQASGPGTAYLLEPHRGVVTPGARLVAWTLTHAAPLSWSAIAAVLIVGQVTVTLLAWRLLRLLFDESWTVLPALAVMVLSPIGLPGALWWSTGLLQLPQHAALLGAFILAVRSMKDGSWWLAHMSATVVGLGCLFSPRTLLATPLILAFSLTHLSDGSFRERVALAFRSRRPLWGAHGVVVLLGLAAWGALAPGSGRAIPSLRAVLDVAQEAVLRGALPGLSGGPWSWTQVGYAAAIANPGPVPTAMAFVIAATVVVLSISWWRGAAAAWVVVAGYVGASVLWAAAGPDAGFGAWVGVDYRTEGDLALVAGLGLAFATGRVSSVEVGHLPGALSTRLAGRAALRRSVIAPLRAAGALPARPGALAAATALGATGLFSASALFSSMTYARTWDANPARAIVERTTSDIAGLPPNARVIDAQVPYEVATPLIQPYTTTFAVFAPVLGDDRELKPGVSATLAVLPDEQGWLRRVVVTGAAARPGPDAGCGWRVANSAREVPFESTPTPQDPIVRLGVLAGEPTTIEVTANGRSSRLDIPGGFSSVYTAASGRLSTVSARVISDGLTICVSDAQAGTAQPLPESRP